MIVAVAAGRLVGRIGTRPFAVVGLALVAIGNAICVYTQIIAQPSLERRVSRGRAASTLECDSVETG